MKREKPQEPGAPLWALTMGDLMTNMLCFFVMLFAFSTMRVEQERAVAKQIEQAFPGINVISNDGANRSIVTGSQGIMMLPNPNKSDMPRVVKRVKRLLQTVSLRDKIEVSTEKQNVKVRIQSDALFDSGQATIKKGSEEVLDALSPMLREIPHDVRIEGHSDDVPVRSASFPSNWELSSARACAVVRYFLDNFDLDPGRFSAQGFGQFRPVIASTTEEARRTNRRVEITLLTSIKRDTTKTRWE